MNKAFANDVGFRRPLRRKHARSLRFERLQSRECLAADPSLIFELTEVSGRDVAASISDASNPASTEALNALTNRVAFAGEGIGNLRVSPDGMLGQIYYIDQSLHYRFRSPTGEFASRFVADVDDYTFLSYERGTPAQLVYRSDGTPVIVIAQEFGFTEHHQNTDGTWSQVSSVTFDPEFPFESTGHLLAEIGPDDSVHVVLTAGDYWIGRMLYATDQSGSWSVSGIADPAAAGAYYHFFGLSSRYVTMAVSQEDGSVHIAYVPEFLDNGEGGFRRPYDQLAYLTNRSGDWSMEIVHQPSDDSGQSGLSSSIAIAPNGQPAIASFFVDRYQTGSAVSSQLLFHLREPNGTWVSEVVTDQADGYVAGDGETFTGFAPHLVFDSFGRPQVAFSDHASHHFPEFGAEEFAGQIRHALKNSGAWHTNTVFRQSDPLRSILSYPTMAILPNETVFAGIQALNGLDENLFPIDIASNYVESVIPQTGLTLEVVQDSVPATDLIEIVIRRHHADLDVSTNVTIQSSDPSRVATISFLIPSGQEQIIRSLPVGDPSSLTENQLVTLSASASGFYPGSTVALIEPPDLKWNNTTLAQDVNDDKDVTPRDALLVINWIGVVLSGGDPQPVDEFWYPDVNADGKVTPIDALRVINYLGRADLIDATPESILPSSVTTQRQGPATSSISSADEEEWLMLMVSERRSELND